jgi:hypothetical protein
MVEERGAVVDAADRILMEFASLTERVFIGAE